ncbi:MAG: hypothetical protein A2381_13155 [Bdellovibrionales bacterium RIFOXYB1_FULL_37_110]|nr:MAG: hypothetical protein A2381_13155 [Bdellovibrionales bacterium RIFOXYB1_FULL_37_110]OFZ65053.1 MAG: hypothetical protein A2577_09420 [Bdellovibrionales bacterium RIFOXYD1_FULL_36_51]
MQKIIGMIVVLYISNLWAADCDIFIHGYTPEGQGYFGDLPRQVVWNANEPIEISAPKVADKILELMDTCEKDAPIVLRPHSYGVAQVHYILGKGKQFQALYPEHKFVQIFQRTTEVYAFTGAYHGTPLMDLICAKKVTQTLGKRFGRLCVTTLTTAKTFNVSNLVQSPGVPTYLIYSSDRSGYGGLLGGIIAKHLVDWKSYIFHGVRNQNDNTLPLYATKACAEQQLIEDPEFECKNLDSNYFVNFYHLKDISHSGYVDDHEFMLIKNQSDETKKPK